LHRSLFIPALERKLVHFRPNSLRSPPILFYSIKPGDPPHPWSTNKLEQLIATGAYAKNSTIEAIKKSHGHLTFKLGEGQELLGPLEVLALLLHNPRLIFKEPTSENESG